MIQNAIEKAAVLIEALPYLHDFRGQTVVVKFGGSILDDNEGCLRILTDIAFMECVGMRPVVVHGGGKAISAAMETAGIAPNFVDGLRVTDTDTISIVDRVLNTEVNPGLVEMLEGLGYRAQGVRGQSVMRAEQHVVEGKDWGFVGDVTSVDCAPIKELLDQEIVPLITPLAIDDEGQSFNINADAAATAVARELQARKLVFVSDVPGVLRDLNDKSSLISTITLNEVQGLIDDGTIAGGMLPKVAGAASAVASGIRKVHFIDSKMPHSLLLELFTDAGVGTQIVSGAVAKT